MKTKTKKLLALIFTLTMVFSLFTATMNAASEAPLSFSVSNGTTFTPGTVNVGIVIQNNGNNKVVITKIEVQPGCDFSQNNIPNLNKEIESGKRDTVPIDVIYDGIGNSLAIKVTSQIGSNTYINDVNIDISKSSAKLSVTAVSANNLMGGKTGNVTLSIVNPNGEALNNVVVQLAGVGDSAKYFTAGQGSLSQTSSLLMSVSVPLTISADIPGGSYILNYTITADSEEGTVPQVTSSITVTVKARDLSTLPYVKSVSIQKADDNNPNRYKMTAVIANPGDSDVGKVTVAFGTQTATGFSLYENFTPVSLGTIAAGKEAQAVFSVYIDSAVAAGNYPLTFTLTYRSSDLSVDTKQDSVAYLELDRGAASSSSTPRIIISKYNTSTDSITSGNAFKLSFSLKNTAKSTDVRNIKVVLSSGTVTSGGAVFVVAEGSNSFYIDSIPKDGEVTKSVQLVANQDAQPGIYPIMLAIDYEDESGKAYSTTEQLSFAVSQEQRLETVGFTVAQSAMQGDMIPVSFQYINKGKATIYNLTISVVGDFKLSTGESYIGNLTAGQNDYFEDNLTASDIGTKSGTVVLKYEGSDGTPHELRQDFTVEVSPMSSSNPMDPGSPTDPTGPINPTSNGMAWWMIVLIVIGAVAVVTVIVVLSVKKARKAKASD